MQGQAGEASWEQWGCEGKESINQSISCPQGGTDDKVRTQIIGNHRCPIGLPSRACRATKCSS